MYQTFERYSTGLRSRLGRAIIFPLLKIILLAFIFYLVITAFFLNSYRVDSDSMRSVLKPGDRVLATPLTYSSRLPFVASRTRPPRRGEIVLVLSPLYTPSRFPLALFEPLVRFVTLQRGSVAADLTGRRVPRYLIKRVIALPGDTLRLENFTAYVRTPGESVFRAEQELISADYQIVGAAPVDGWQESFPLSGNAAAVTLGNNEYFVLGDNRGASSDSRSWGPVGGERIVARVFLKYWPFRDSGRL
jgi:signal peptidase I